MIESEPILLDEPERSWFLDDRLKKMDHVVHVDTSDSIPFKNKKGKTDALFPDELEKMQLLVGKSLFEDCDTQGEEGLAGFILSGQVRYPGKEEDEAGENVGSGSESV